jgi:Fic family protein
MVSITPEKKGNSIFYYLRHNSGTKEKKKYLGKTIPKDIEKIKYEFLMEFYRQLWNPKIQNILTNYKKHSKKLPSFIQFQNFENFGIIFTYNTQKMEGSSLTQEDTKDLLIHKITPNKKSQIDAIETQRHYDLFMKLISSKKSKNITQDMVLCWHKEIFGQTKIGEAGCIRSYRVGIVGNDTIEFSSVPEIKPKLKKLFRWINKYDDKIMSPVELACIAHYEFVNIHPFGDGNGRISRLLTNYILYKYGYPLLLIKNIDRKRYFKSLERSNIQNNSVHFLKWFMKYYIKENKQYL